MSDTSGAAGTDLAAARPVARAFPRRKVVQGKMQRDDSLVQFSALLTVQLANDLQNLLAIMARCADSLAGRTVGLEGADRDFADLNEAIDGGFRLSRELLALVGRQQTHEPLVIDIHELLERYRPILQRLLGADIQLVVTTSEAKNLLVLATPVQLEWMLLNIAANGRDAMPDGGVLHVDTAAVETWMRPPGGAVRRERYLRLTMRDQGPGFAADVKTRLFEPFFTTKRFGTGLGLTSVVVTVRALKGWLYVENGRPSGTSVHVLLPLYAEPAPSHANGAQ
jgi:C4-dicarboxylate-specific signal transduction histidine kinase